MLDFFLTYLLVWKYAVLVVVASFASFGIPLPATALFMAAGAFAAQGFFEMTSIFAYGFAACVIGDVSAYAVSKRYGKKVFYYVGLGRILRSAKFAALEDVFAKHSGSAIFTSRFLATGLGPAVNLLSGFSKISFKKFILLDLVGEGIYVVVFSGLGYVFGDQWEAISSITEDVTSIFLLCAVIAVVLAVAWKFRKPKSV